MQSTENQNSKTSEKNMNDFRKTVHVKSEKRSLGYLIWLIIIPVGILLAIMFLSGHHKLKKIPTEFSAPNDYQNELNQNLEKISEEGNSKKASLSQNSSSESKFTKEYIARQNAPTTIYDSREQRSQNIISKNERTKILIDHSANADFVNHMTQPSSVSASKILHPKFTIASGEFIHTELETAIHSDLPGNLRAIVTRPVYAYIGEQPLIPAGSRLIGQYSSAILQGQNRVMIIWNRIILPDGVAINVNSPGTDPLGRAGQGADVIDTHFLKRFGEASLLSIIAAGVSNTGVRTEDQYNSAAQYRMAIAESFQQASQQSLQNTLAIKPTLHVYQGSRLNVFVTHDLSFYTVLSHRDD